MQDLKEIAEIPLHHLFLDAIKNENYELCAEIRDEFNKRLATHTFCQYSYIVIKRSEQLEYGLLDNADGYYLILTEIK